MKKQLSISGIRLNKQYVQVTSTPINSLDISSVPLYKKFEQKKINMVFMTLTAMGNYSIVSSAISVSGFDRYVAKKVDEFKNYHKVSIFSLYPHHYRLELVGSVMSFLGEKKIRFTQMVTSNAMLTFIVDQENCDPVIHMLYENMAVSSPFPVEQEENQKLTQFLKKKYPETRATYVENKIKTYGIILVQELILSSFRVPFDQLVGFGQTLADQNKIDNAFIHAYGHMDSQDLSHLFFVTKHTVNGPGRHSSCEVELIRLQGPHFGDRYGIIGRALDCLSGYAIPVLHTGCTGASICIVLPKNYGMQAQTVLLEGFDVP